MSNILQQGSSVGTPEGVSAAPQAGQESRSRVAPDVQAMRARFREAADEVAPDLGDSEERGTASAMCGEA